MGVNAILDLLEICPSLAVFVCDGKGRIQGTSRAASVLLKEELGRLTGRCFLDLCSTQPRDGRSSFRSFAQLAKNGVSVQFDALPTDNVVVRVREVDAESELFAVSMERDAPVVEPESERLPARPDMLLAVAEEIAEFGCFTWHMTVDRLEWSDALLKIFGINRSQFSGTGDAFFSRIHPDDQDGIRESFEAAIANGGRFESAERIIRPNGEVRWLESLGRLITDADGNPQQLRGVCRDITHFRNKEDELDRQVRALQQLAECATEMFSRSRSEDNWASLLLRLGQLVGADILHHCILDDGNVSPSVFQESGPTTANTAQRMAVLKELGNRCTSSGLDIYCSADERPVDSFDRKLCVASLHSCYGIPLFFNGECIGTLSYASTTGGFSDADRHFLKLVAHVVCAAHNRKQLERLGDREKLLYEGAVRHANMVIWELDTKTNCFTYVSASCEDLTGYKPEEWYEPGFWESHLHSDDREASVDFCQNATKNQKDHRFEYRMVTRDGGIIWIDDIVQVVLEHGDVIGLRGTLIDITERKSLEQQLLQAQKMEAIGNLTSGIAHDFNNLLTVIVSASELLQLQRREVLADDARDLVHAIQDAADRASQLTNQLLLFSRSSIPKRQLVDINATITESHQFLSRILGSDKQLSLKLAAGLSPVRIDPTHLQQILLNLAVNARDAMPDGGDLSIQTNVTARSHSKIPSHVRTAGMGDFVVLSVTDTGVGVPDDLKSRIFDPFFTTKPVGSGTGLGLSVVYGIVHEAGGFIEVDSEVGGGAQFRVYLPAITGEVNSSDDAVEDLPGGQETILVVEDDPEVMRVTVKTLEQAGYHVIGILDPVEAARFASSSQQRINLMVTDVSMPNLSGPDLAKLIQGSSESLPFPVLFMSGNDQNILEAKHGISIDADNFIQKPFRISMLIKKAQQLLSSRMH